MLQLVFIIAIGQALVAVGGSSYIDVVMIVDESSALAAITAIESIMMHAQSQSRLRLNIVSNDGDSGSDKGGFEEKFLRSLSCFESLRMGMLKIAPFLPASLVPPMLLASCQKFKHICARFYVPTIFPHLNDRYIYLDNDVLATIDIRELWDTKIVRLAHFEEQSSIPLDKKKSRSHPQHDIEDGNRNVDGVRLSKTTLQPIFRGKPKIPHSRRRLSVDSTKLKVLRDRNPAASFVWEKHPFYEVYIDGNFNTSHPLVSAVIRKRGGKRMFFNAGIAVIDVVTWNIRNVTGHFERLMLTNSDNRMFDFDSAGDQAAFYLMNDFVDLGAIPNARFNMRRLPKKTIQLLESGVSGIIHWAGTTGVHTEELCKNLDKFPLFVESGAMSEFKKVVKSLAKRCPNSIYLYDKECLENIHS